MEALVLANASLHAGHEDPAGTMALLERVGRVCHASEDKIGPGSADKFVRMLIKLGHESVLEHHSITVKVTCDRGTSHQWVRHRLGSYTQSSQRYIDLASDKRHPCRFIDPEFRSRSAGQRYTASEVETAGAPDDVLTLYRVYYSSCLQARDAYDKLRESGAPPEDARAILPNGTLTEFYVTFNLRQWRHFFQERCSPAAQHIINRLASELLTELYKILPVCFEDLYGKFARNRDSTE